MPYLVQSNSPDVWAKRARRVLIVGSPNSGKTTSLTTWPKPIAIQSYPGEKGTTSIPNGEGIQSFVWDHPDPEKGVDWAGVVRETRQLTVELLAGKHGTIQTFAGDGLHKLHSVFLAEVCGGANMRGEDFEPRLYGPAHTKFFQYIDLVTRSNVPNVVFTVWDGHEKDDPDERGSSPSRHVFPELPGPTAPKRMMGEFAVGLYATREGSGPATQFMWLTQPTGKVWGAGLKMPAEIAKRVPLKVKQDWTVLEKILIPGV